MSKKTKMDTTKNSIRESVKKVSNKQILKTMRTNWKNAVWAVLIALSLGFVSCSADDEVAPASVNTRAVASITVSGVITGTNNWSGTVYLDGKVFLVNGTLNIAAGTEIIGLAKATPEEASALVITRTGTINAVGTSSNPVVFKGETETVGSWGGLVVLGDGIINQTTSQTIEGITAEQAAGNDITYGTPYGDLTVGTPAYDAALNDNSGTLSYVRVEYAGAAISEANELNAFTFGGVGAGTTLDHLQAYYGKDDAFEFFGGSVNAKYLISTATADDAFDFDFGYTGNLQFLVAVIDPSDAQVYTTDPNGIESDNDGIASSLLPFTHPVISNITIAGTADGTVADGENNNSLLAAARFRRNSSFTLVNAIFYGYPTGVWNNNANASFTLDTNVGTALPSTNTYVGFTSLPASDVTVANAASLELDSPFGSYKNDGLTPSSGDAAGVPYDASLLDAFFDTPVFLGGANDSDLFGTNWLSATWVR
jgi:hypothetical protein